MRDIEWCAKNESGLDLDHKDVKVLYKIICDFKEKLLRCDKDIATLERSLAKAEQFVNDLGHYY